MNESRCLQQYTIYNIQSLMLFAILSLTTKQQQHNDSYYNKYIISKCVSKFLKYFFKLTLLIVYLPYRNPYYKIEFVIFKFGRYHSTCIGVVSDNLLTEQRWVRIMIGRLHCSHVRDILFLPYFCQESWYDLKCRK